VIIPDGAQDRRGAACRITCCVGMSWGTPGAWCSGAGVAKRRA